MFKLVNDIIQHPANRHARVTSLIRACQWQFLKRMSGKPYDISYHGKILRCYPNLDFFRFKRLVLAHILSAFAHNGIVFEHPRLPGPVQKPIPAIGSVVPWHAYPKTLCDSSPAMTLSFDVSESSR